MTLLLSQQPRSLNGNSCMIGEETECELEDLAKHVRFDFLVCRTPLRGVELKVRGWDSRTSLPV